MYNDLYYVGEFKKFSVKVNKDALLEYERLKQNDLFATIKKITISEDALTILVNNIRSLSKHVNNVISDDRIMNSGNIRLTKSICQILYAK